jgi:hypothetical protein
LIKTPKSGPSCDGPLLFGFTKSSLEVVSSLSMFRNIQAFPFGDFAYSQANQNIHYFKGNK